MKKRIAIAFSIALVPVLACAFCASSCVSGGKKSSTASAPSASALTASSPTANGPAAKDPVAKDKAELIRGRVKIFGNEPHTYAGIETEDHSCIYAVSPPEMEKVIRELQGHLIEFKVRFLPKPEGEGSLYLKDGTVVLLAWKIIE